MKNQFLVGGNMLGDYTFIQQTTQFNEPYSSMRDDDVITQSPEVNDGEKLTLDEGYVDYKKSIQDKFLAGEQLANQRLFDPPEALSNEDYANAVARIRHPNTDIVDIQNYTDALNNRISAAKSVAQRHQIQQDIDLQNEFSGRDKKAPDTPIEASPDPS